MIVIVDVGLGNLRSVERALAAVGRTSKIASDPDVVRRADALVVPGHDATHATSAARYRYESRGLSSPTPRASELSPPRISSPALSAAFGEIARHILQAGHGLTSLMLEGVENMATPDFRPLMEKHLAGLPKSEGAGALAHELRCRFEADSTKLAAQSLDFFAGEITRFDGQRVTRLEMLQGIKEHELTHRSQLFMYLRLKGIVPSTTRQRLAKAKA